MAKATCTKCRACPQNQAVKIGPGSSRPRKLNDVSDGMTTFGRRQPRVLDPTPGPRNLNENPARRAFGKKQKQGQARNPKANCRQAHCNFMMCVYTCVALERSGAICNALERSGATWNNPDRSGAIWNDLGQSGMIWSDLERSGPLQSSGPIGQADPR